MNGRNKQKAGFTIVELLIVIVVIGILAAITIVAYNGIQDRAQNSARAVELRAWEKSFRLYAAQEGTFPAMPNGGYCLGTGFPDKDGTGAGNCRDTLSTSTRYSTSPALNAELAKVGTLPSGPRSILPGAALGPYVNYSSANSITITTIVKGTTCPDGTSSSYSYPVNQARMCTISLSSN